MQKKFDADIELNNLKKLSSYDIINISTVKEINAKTVSLVHKKTKAKVFCILKNDENKTFSIGFRTPNKAHTGVQHILEHSVLCGSRKYPLKDPFIELVKGSLSTFLNAMTYPDRTIYPLASCNEKDFDNLCDVYLDAVFYPNVYNEEKIFKQEGWHYELNDNNLDISGVVYNEMKGVFSSPEATLERYISDELFNNHPYSYESGGDPDFIPELTYEEFINFHKIYYHPSNSFIYLYGDLDFAKKLQYIDNEYLNDFEYKEINSSIDKVTLENKIKIVEKEYPILENEDEENRYFLSLHYALGDILNEQEAIGFNILEYYLLSSPCAKIKEALVKAGIGEEISGDFETSIRANYFSIVAKNANIADKDKFVDIINDILLDIVNNCIDKAEILSIINMMEFKFREADFGSYPSGILYALSVYSKWIYDLDPNIGLKYEDAFKYIRENLDNGFFETLVKKYLLDNKSLLNLTLKPVKNLENIKHNEYVEKMSRILSNMSEEEKKSILVDNKKLKEYQEQGDKKEDIEKLPKLHVSELDKESRYVEYKKYDYKDCTIIHTDIDTSKIAYLNILFDITNASGYELNTIGLLQEVLTMMDTKNYKYSQLSNEINNYLGGLSYTTISYNINKNSVKSYLMLSSKSFYNNIDKMLSLINEVNINTIFSDKQRLYNLILELKASIKSKLVAQGHITAMNRALSKFSLGKRIDEALSGIDFYRYLNTITLENIDKIAEDLKNIYVKFINKNNSIFNITCDKVGYDTIINNIDIVINNLNTTIYKEREELEQNIHLSEAFTSVSKVNYVAVAANILGEGEEYSGIFRLVKSLLNYDYLWTNVRLIGNAYGCMSGISNIGDFYMASYRDPNLVNTFTTYENVVAYFKNYNGSKQDVDRAIIGAIGELDSPLNNRLKGLKALTEYITNNTREKMDKVRKEILNSTKEDIINFASYIQDYYKNAYKVVVGNEKIINDNKEYFNNIEEI